MVCTYIHSFVSKRTLKVNKTIFCLLIFKTKFYFVFIVFFLSWIPTISCLSFCLLWIQHNTLKGIPGDQRLFSFPSSYFRKICDSGYFHDAILFLDDITYQVQIDPSKSDMISPSHPSWPILWEESNSLKKTTLFMSQALSNRV